MNARRNARSGVGGLLVLDNEGVMRLSDPGLGGRAARARLEAARRRGAVVKTSAAILAEILRGNDRDARVHQIINKIGVTPVSERIGARAGRLIGAAGLETSEAVDAMVAATAIEHVEEAERSGRIITALIVTSDIPHLAKLVDGHDRVKIVHVDGFPAPTAP